MAKNKIDRDEQLKKFERLELEQCSKNSWVRIFVSQMS